MRALTDEEIDKKIKEYFWKAKNIAMHYEIEYEDVIEFNISIIDKLFAPIPYPQPFKPLMSWSSPSSPPPPPRQEDKEEEQ